jgi:bacteriocin biosynthesis cyclodehydratase domain-containing protein
MVQALLRQRVIVDAGLEQTLSAHEREAFASLLVMLARSSSEPYRLLGQLRGARVVVLGDLELSREVVLGLSECAIGRIDLLVEEPAPERGVSLPAGVRVLPMEELEAVVPGADLVIGVQDGELNSPRRLRELNRLCLRLGTSWLRLQLTLDAEGWIGPLHAPGSACFECLELRLEGNLQTRREQRLHREQVERGLLPARRLGFGPFQRQLASAMALEVLLLLTGLEPSRLVGRGLLLDMLAHERSMHPVLKHPACPACGKPPEDRLRPWSKEEIRPGRTLLKEPVAK